MKIMNRSKMNLPRVYFLGLRLRVIVIPFKNVVVFGAVGEMASEPLVILFEKRDAVLRFEKLFVPELVLVHPVVTRMCGRISCRSEKRDVVLQ